MEGGTKRKKNTTKTTSKAKAVGQGGAGCRKQKRLFDTGGEGQPNNSRRTETRGNGSGEVQLKKLKDWQVSQKMSAMKEKAKSKNTKAHRSWREPTSKM